MFQQKKQPQLHQVSQKLSSNQFGWFKDQHPRICKLIQEQKNIQNFMMNQISSNKIKLNRYHLLKIEQRKWLKKKGKNFLIDFDERQRKYMKHYYKALDKQQKGWIGIDELQEYLLSIGIFQTRQQIKILVTSVKNKGYCIKFDDFLKITQNDDIKQFYKDLIQNKQNISNANKIVKKINFQKIQFSILISYIRRKYMLTALNISSNEFSKEEILKAQKVLIALRNMWDRRMVKKIQDSCRKNKYLID